MSRVTLYPLTAPAVNPETMLLSPLEHTWKPIRFTQQARQGRERTRVVGSPREEACQTRLPVSSRSLAINPFPEPITTAACASCVMSEMCPSPSYLQRTLPVSELTAS